MDVLCAALDQRKATLGAIASGAKAGHVWRVMKAYIEAIVADELSRIVEAEDHNDRFNGH